MADEHLELVRSFEEAEQASQRGRADGEKARDYYDGRQLSEQQIRILNKRKQPIVIENLIRPKIDYLCGLERQSRTDPKAWPRTAKHEDDANAATDALRYVCDDEDFTVKRSAVFQNMLVEGFGGIEIDTKPVRGGGLDPKLNYIPWDRLFYDPHSMSHDFEDARFVGFVTWMDTDQAKEQYPDAGDIIDTTMSKPHSGLWDTYDDKPKWTYWADSKRKRIRIITIYRKRAEGWTRCVYTLSGVLEKEALTGLVDEDGYHCCRLIMQSAYIDRDNDRYGIVRDLTSLQDEVNKRRSKFLHLSNSRQYRVGRSLMQDAERIRQEMSRPDGVVVADPGELELISNGDLAAGHFNLLAEAKQAIQSTGPNATMQGKAGQDQSGRAILALQQGGMTEMAPLLDALRHFNIRVYRALWRLIRIIWSGERWMRVTDDEKNLRWVGLNVTKGRLAEQKLTDAFKAGQIDEQTAQQYAMQLQSDPSMAEPANSVAELDVDIELDEVVDAPALQIEQFEQLVKLAPMTPPNYLPTMFEMLIEASSLRNKDKLREIMEQGKQQQSQPNPMQEIQMRGAMAEVSKTEAEAAKTAAQAQNEQMKPMIEGAKFAAQTGAQAFPA